jgi:hypothetical protein
MADGREVKLRWLGRPRRTAQWKHELDCDQADPRVRPTLPKLRFMDGTKWGVDPEGGPQERD